MLIRFKMNKRYYLMLVLASVLTLSACKKNKSEPQPTTRAELSLDSIFLYAKQVYYWNDKLPTYEIFNPRKYTGSTDLDRYENALFGIAGYSANKYDVYKEGGVYQNYPKYSFIIDQKEDSGLAGAILNSNNYAVDWNGNGNDIGIRVVSYLLDNTYTKYLPFVTAVYPNSPADHAGIKRGWVITKINGQTYGTNYTNEKKSLNDALNANSVPLELTNYLTGTKINITLTKTAYKTSPIYASKIFTAGAKKIGYINLARFSILTGLFNDPANYTDTYLDPVFAEFASAGVTDLVVDLRYNGGGYSVMVDHMLNLMAPSSLDGQTTYAEYYNSTMTNDKATILKNQPMLDANNKIQYQNGQIVNYYDHGDYSVSGNTMHFKKKGNLNTVQNIVFLVTGNTASSSELVINALKPYMNVKLVGETTYGKPIGFFPLVIENRYQVWMSMIETKNSRGEGGYFDGMKPDYDENEIIGYDKDENPIYKYPDLWDDVRYDFGDPKEAYLAQALQILAPGVTVQSSGAGGKLAKTNSTSANPAGTLSKSKITGKQKLGKEEFVGMIDQPKRKQ